MKKHMIQTCAGKEINRKALWAYVYMPILYTLIGIILLGTLVFPYKSLAGNLLNMLIYQDPQETGLTSIFEGYKAPETSDRQETEIPRTGEATTGEVTPPQTEPDGIHTVDNSKVQIPGYNTEYAHINCDRLSIDCKLYFGDSAEALRYGAGQYIGSWLPGYNGTILVAGHNTGVFYNLQYVSEGDIFTVTTNYGIYTYEVTEYKILNHKDKTAYDLSQTDEEMLVLYTCWPFKKMAAVKTDRLFVYCKKISGPTVVGIHG